MNCYYNNGYINNTCIQWKFEFSIQCICIIYYTYYTLYTINEIYVYGKSNLNHIYIYNTIDIRIIKVDCESRYTYT